MEPFMTRDANKTQPLSDVAATTSAGPQIGDQGPDFELTRDDGTTLRAKDLKAKPYVIYFYPKDDTSGCTQEAIDFSALSKDFAKIGCAVIGVSRDSVKSHAKFRDKHALTVTLGSDEAGSVTEQYGVWVEKSMYGRKYMGIERATFLHDATGKVVKVWRKVKIPGHAAEVLKSAQELSKK
jgi:peroxiredoxin Q/BCP